ncbi:ketopantoate reductase family protein [Roseomonas marmotae]|uniref:2-dehydropantoate 2-reductase n=1 Tax=Roseomonas marmotae TaxID=2768161 RepID=A0ABS3K714_9PROT|nr:2-dehydropantoate 2-reductase N-terminal domain-containing protein [Roseomonas marmotae]MBO1073249.1 NAD(P)-binding domain-containing protein [Roseomonas marmotae]QTI79127.1 NAD(P)-binding domain-containing protein [Roseomonas marmotae]
MESVVIWGSGAIGGTIGACLRRAGHDVLFVDVVPEHVEAISAGKLRIEGPVVDFTIGGPAALPEQVKGRHKLIILAVKAHHTEAATRALLPHLAEDGAVVSCQNGLNELTIAEIVGRQRTIGAFVNFYADYMAPGHISYAKRGAVVVGEMDGSRTPRLEALHRMLRDFDEDAVLSDNVFGYLWGKGGYGAILKASALTNDTIADFIAAPERRVLILRLVQEILAVAAAEGVTPLGFDGFDPIAFMQRDEAAIEASMQRMIAFNRGSAKPRSGVWRDLAIRKRQTDVVAQLAPVRAAARGHGLATPIADKLAELISEIEQGRREIGPEAADALSLAAQS